MVVLLFIVALAIIVVASELFTNAVEWAGYRLHLGSGATGSLLAAIGTALPETTVPVVALLTGASNAVAVATGAVLGAPLLLLTLGAGITGFGVVARRRRPRIEVPPQQARRDLGFFVGAFSLSFVAMALPAVVHPIVGVILLGLYVTYVTLTLRGSDASEEMPEPLHLTRLITDEDPHAVFISLQLLLAVAGLVYGSDLFVSALDEASAALGISALLLAIVLVPFATELPETLNSLLWIRSDDDGLAFGNVAGSATFQACILGFIGVTFTPWHPAAEGVVSAAVALGTGICLLVLLGRTGRARGDLLALAVVPWIGYVVLSVATAGRL